jgi:hypothetical protein
LGAVADSWSSGRVNSREFITLLGLMARARIPCAHPVKSVGQ